MTVSEPILCGTIQWTAKFADNSPLSSAFTFTIDANDAFKINFSTQTSDNSQAGTYNIKITASCSGSASSSFTSVTFDQEIENIATDCQNIATITTTAIDRTIYKLGQQKISLPLNFSADPSECNQDVVVAEITDPIQPV